MGSSRGMSYDTMTSSGVNVLVKCLPAELRTRGMHGRDDGQTDANFLGVRRFLVKHFVFFPTKGTIHHSSHPVLADARVHNLKTSDLVRRDSCCRLSK